MTDEIGVKYEDWVKRFKPVKNHIVVSDTMDGFMFETFGAEYEFLRAQDPYNIWTLVDTAEGEVIVNGWHYVNRLGYFVTRVKWGRDEHTTIEVDLE